MAASSRLPGFLRRSVLANDSEDDEESVSSSSSSLQGDADKDNPQSDAMTAEDEANHKERDEVSPIIASVAGSTSSRASMPSSMTEPKPAVLNRQSSEPRVVHASQAGPEDFPGTPEATNEFQRSQTTPVRSVGQSPQEGIQATKASSSRPKSYRVTQFEKIFAANVVSMNDLKTLSWNGIPVSLIPCCGDASSSVLLRVFGQISNTEPCFFCQPSFRPQSWKIIFGYLPTNASRREHTLKKKRSEYKDAIGQHYYIDDNSRTIQEQEVLRQVLVDVPRTAPEVQLFRDERIKLLLTRILYIWAMRHPASSYVQGINDLAMPLIVTFLTERPSTTESDSKNDLEIIGYDEVLDGSIMESVSDERLDEVSCHLFLTTFLIHYDCNLKCGLLFLGVSFFS